MGRIPVMAAPIATPAIPASEIGVSRMRSWPNSSDRPRVTVNAPPNPPGMPMSSPRQKTVGSRSISSRIPSRNASAIVICGTKHLPPGAVHNLVLETGSHGASSLSLPEDMQQGVFGRRGGALLRKGHCILYVGRNIVLDLLQRLHRNRAGLQGQVVCQAQQRVLGAPLRLLLAGSVATGIAAGVAAQAVGLALD